MKLTGGCYCRQIRYEAEGKPMNRMQCHCRECMYMSSGGPVQIMSMPAEGFRVTSGEMKSFTRTDIPDAITREFCPNCGTQILSRVPVLPDAVLLRVGTLDDIAVFGMPEIALFVREKLPFHHVPEGTLPFETYPEQ